MAGITGIEVIQDKICIGIRKTRFMEHIRFYKYDKKDSNYVIYIY